MLGGQRLAAMPELRASLPPLQQALALGNNNGSRARSAKMSKAGTGNTKASFLLDDSGSLVLNQMSDEEAARRHMRITAVADDAIASKMVEVADNANLFYRHKGAAQSRLRARLISNRFAQASDEAAFQAFSLRDRSRAVRVLRCIIAVHFAVSLLDSLYFSRRKNSFRRSYTTRAELAHWWCVAIDGGCRLPLTTPRDATRRHARVPPLTQAPPCLPTQGICSSPCLSWPPPISRSNGSCHWGCGTGSYGSRGSSTCWRRV